MNIEMERAGCAGYNRLRRRRFLQSCGAGAIATGWLTPFAEQLARAEQRDKGASPKSLLMIWLQGAPSQLETFDPHPGSKIGGDAKSIVTSLKGLSIADSMPATAEWMHQTTLVRSVVSKEGDHERATYHLKTGWRPDPTLVHPALGAIVAHKSPDNIEIPRHVSISPSQWPARGGYLGPKLDAFQIGDPEKPIPNLTARVDEPRMQQRMGPLLAAVEAEFQRGRLKDMDNQRTLHQTATEKAARMMSSDQLEAFDISKESQSKRDSFGNNEFGRGLLAAIRLLQTGVRCVEVELSGWDSHVNNHDNQYENAGVLDTALAATLRELTDRGMLDDTVVFCGGEFGRTPRINAAAGRDHWPHGFSSLLAGGKFRKGHVHGETAASIDPERLKEPGKEDRKHFVSDEISVPDLHATLLDALGVDYSEEQLTPIGRPLRWSDGEAVKSLLDA